MNMHCFQKSLFSSLLALVVLAPFTCLCNGAIPPAIKSQPFIVHDNTDLPRSIKGVVERVEAMQTRVNAYVERRSIFKHLASTEVRKECVNALAECLSLKEDTSRIEELYIQELKTLENNKIYETLFQPEIYIYNFETAAQRLKAGEKLKNIHLNESGFAIEDDWNPDFIRDQIVIGMPITIWVHPKLTDYESYVQEYTLDPRERLIKEHIKAANAQIAYRFTVDLMRNILKDRFLAMPTWLREGIASYMGMATSVMWFGQKDGLAALAPYLEVEAAWKIDRKNMAIETWDPAKNDHITNKAYVLAVFQAIHAATLTYGKNGSYLPRLLMKLKKQNEITLETVVVESKALKKDLDFKALLPPNAPPRVVTN